MTQETLKIALEAMYPIAHNTTDDPRGQAYKAIAAIKEALAQPEQETVGYWKEHAQGMQRDYDLLLADYEKLAQPEQGPVAWRTFDGEGGYDYRSYEDNESYADDWDKRNPNHKGWVEPLYTTSQKRTWVGLTVEEVEKIWQGVEASDFHDCVQPFAQAIENILKDKNCVG